MATVIQTLTLEEFLAPPEGAARQELNSGELVEMPPGTHGHSQVLHAFLFRLYEAAKKQGRFEARSETAFVLSAEPLTVRVPDVSLVAVDRLLAAPANAYIEGAPEVAIEVVSPSDTASYLNEKTRQYPVLRLLDRDRGLSENKGSSRSSHRRTDRDSQKR